MSIAKNVQKTTGHRLSIIEHAICAEVDRQLKSIHDQIAAQNRTAAEPMRPHDFDVFERRLK